MLELNERLLELVSRAEGDFAGLREADTTQPVISGGWSRKQILGHLIDSASNNHLRFVGALLQDELHGSTYDQEGCVRVQRYQDLPWSELLLLWAAYNRFLAHILAGVPDAKRATPCFIAQNPVLTLEELAADYLVHMEHHLEQLALSVDKR
jgi:DinB superfamily